jgi:hypothetical protein
METSSAKRIVAGGLFALFFAFIVAALTVFGVINMALGHIFMACSFAVGVLIIWTELIPARPARHKLAFTFALLAVLLVADLAIVKVKEGGHSLSIGQHVGIPSVQIWHWLVGPHGRWFDKVLGAIYAFAFIFAVLFVAAVGKVVNATVSANKPKAAKGFLDYRMDVETAMTALPPLIEELSKIMTQVAPAISKHAATLVQASSAAEQVKIAKAAASSLDGYSRRVNNLRVRYVETGKLLSEGFIGWSAWISKSRPAKASVAGFAELLRSFTTNVGIAND